MLRLLKTTAKYSTVLLATSLMVGCMSLRIVDPDPKSYWEKPNTDKREMAMDKINCINKTDATFLPRKQAIREVRRCMRKKGYKRKRY